MCKFGKRPAFVAAVFTVAFNVSQVNAAPPTHPIIHTFEPTDAESTNPDGSNSDARAGLAVAIRNDTAIVGMPGLNKIALYKRTTAGWTRTGSIAAPDSSSEFGRAIAYRDNTIIVGADSAAYVFKLANGAWQYRQKLTGETAAFTFGALTYQDNLVVSGSPQWDRPGVVHVFELTSAGKLVRRLKLQAADASANDLFGADVSMSTNTILVGAPGSSGGAAYVFKRSTRGWSQSQRLYGTGSTDESFGMSVAINNGIIAVGAPGEDYEWSDTPDGPNVAGGAVFMFVPNAAGAYVEAQKVRPSSTDISNFESFGTNVAMSGSRLVVLGSEFTFGPGDYAAGQAFTYSLTNGIATLRGLASVSPPFYSVGFFNNWLLVGQPYDGGCGFHGCVGRATLYDTNRLQ